jgi:hypothetical protein
MPAFLHVSFTISLQCSLSGRGLQCSREGRSEGLPQLSGQKPLLRIGVTCAVIVVGSAIIGSQLSIGNLPQLAPTVADEEDGGTREDDTYTGSGSEFVDEDETETAEDMLEESSAEDSENLAEVTEESEEPFAKEGETVPGQAGDAVAGDSTEDESGEGEDSWIIGPSPDF